jgi:hypothetical protein
MGKGFTSNGTRITPATDYSHPGFLKPLARMHFKAHIDQAHDDRAPMIRQNFPTARDLTIKNFLVRFYFSVFVWTVVLVYLIFDFN